MSSGPGAVTSSITGAGPRGGGGGGGGGGGAITTSCAWLAQAWQCPNGFLTGQEGGSPAVQAGSEYPPLAPQGRYPPDPTGH